MAVPLGIFQPATGSVNTVLKAEAATALPIEALGFNSSSVDYLVL